MLFSSFMWPSLFLYTLLPKILLNTVNTSSPRIQSQPTATRLPCHCADIVSQQHCYQPSKVKKPTGKDWVFILQTAILSRFPCSRTLSDFSSVSLGPLQSFQIAIRWSIKYKANSITFLFKNFPIAFEIKYNIWGLAGKTYHDPASCSLCWCLHSIHTEPPIVPELLSTPSLC